MVWERRWTLDMLVRQIATKLSVKRARGERYSDRYSRVCKKKNPL